VPVDAGAPRQAAHDAACCVSVQSAAVSAPVAVPRRVRWTAVSMAQVGWSGCERDRAGWLPLPKIRSVLWPLAALRKFVGRGSWVSYC
jgi:hypothetical protein